MGAIGREQLGARHEQMKTLREQMGASQEQLGADREQMGAVCSIHTRGLNSDNNSPDNKFSDNNFPELYEMSRGTR